MRKTLCLLLAVVAAAVAVAATAPDATALTEDEVADALFRKINNKRANVHGLERLKEWSVIVGEAAAHSAEQARRGQISHDGFQGRANRIRAAGAGINGVCENVAFVRGVTALKDIVRIFYRGWDRSRDHHACMFDELFNATWAGVGVVRTGDTWYATFIEAQDGSPNRP
jgi:uncharacterized protein YkwD